MHADHETCMHDHDVRPDISSRGREGGEKGNKTFLIKTEIASFP